MFEEFVKAWVAGAWNGSVPQGRETLYALLAPECELAGAGGDVPTLIGPAAYEPYWRQLRDAFPDLRCEVEELLPGAHERVGSIRFAMRGTHLGPFFDKAPTHNRIDVKGSATIWLDHEGRAVRIKNVFDVASLLDQIGLAVDSVDKAARAAIDRRESDRQDAQR